LTHGRGSLHVAQSAKYVVYAWKSFKATTRLGATLCLTVCGTDWMEGEYRKPWKREQAKVVADAKTRIKNYIAAGFEQGYKRFFARLEHERILKMITSAVDC
jgi:hypothetical protein